MPPLRPFLLAALVVFSGLPRAEAHGPESILLVVNADIADSVQVGEHYARLRAIPDANVLRLPMSVADEVTRDDYTRRIERPITDWLGRHAAHDRILFIVLTKGVPLRIGGTTGRQATVASVDSELAVLYRRLTGRPVPTAGPVPNPYFLGDRPIAEAKPFSRADHDIYLVTRLDAFTTAEATELANRGHAASQAASAGLVAGRVALDQKAAIGDRANEWLKAAASRLETLGLGDRVLLEATSAVVRDQADLLGYYSWGSNDPSIRDRALGLRFVPGAVAGQFVSTDGRTFAEPPPGWSLPVPNQRALLFAGSAQSLAGDLIRQGVSGVSAQVAEPFLDAAVRPDILFPAYLSGLSLAEAFYLAIPSLSWQTVVVGDPLARVAPGKPTPVLESPIDPTTEQPRLFSARRLESFAAPGVILDAVRAMMRASARSARGDQAGARKALEEAVQLGPKMVAPRLALATLVEQSADYATARTLYREVLALDGRNVIALNNLAYSVAVFEKLPGDALPFAERAYALAGGDPLVSDTLGWVHHLLGNASLAARHVGEALRGEPGNADVRLHAAAILVAAGDLQNAKGHFDLALKLDAGLEKRNADLVAELRSKLQ